MKTLFFVLLFTVFSSISWYANINKETIEVKQESVLLTVEEINKFQNIDWEREYLKERTVIYQVTRSYIPFIWNHTPLETSHWSYFTQNRSKKGDN